MVGKYLITFLLLLFFTTLIIFLKYNCLRQETFLIRITLFAMIRAAFWVLRAAFCVLRAAGSAAVTVHSEFIGRLFVLNAP